MHRPPLPQEKSLVLTFRGWVYLRAHGSVRGGWKNSPLTPLGIDTGTVRLVAQCLNHYATPGPVDASTVSNFYSTWSICSFTWNLGYEGFTACDTLQLVTVLVKMLKKIGGRGHAIDIYQWSDNNCPLCERWRWQTGSFTLRSGQE